MSKKSKTNVEVDQDYLDCLKEFQEYLTNGIPELEVEYIEEDDEESVWILSSFYMNNSKHRTTRIHGAFKTKAEAKCYLRRLRCDLPEQFKCYMSGHSMKIMSRTNKNFVMFYRIEKVYYL